jgi:hypothetical protein
VLFTAKPEEWDKVAGDTTAIIAKDIPVNNDVSSVDIELTPRDTYKDPGEYFFDIQVLKAGVSLYRPIEGKFEIDGSPTNRGAQAWLSS